MAFLQLGKQQLEPRVHHLQCSDEQLADRVEETVDPRLLRFPRKLGHAVRSDWAAQSRERSSSAPSTNPASAANPTDCHGLSRTY
jgi:hypothetical protein